MLICQCFCLVLDRLPSGTNGIDWHKTPDSCRGQGTIISAVPGWCWPFGSSWLDHWKLQNILLWYGAELCNKLGHRCHPKKPKTQSCCVNGGLQVFLDLHRSAAFPKASPQTVRGLSNELVSQTSTSWPWTCKRHTAILRWKSAELWSCGTTGWFSHAAGAACLTTFPSAQNDTQNDWNPKLHHPIFMTQRIAHGDCCGEPWT